MEAYIDWIRDEALPTWASHGHDPASGRFRERLDAAARPLGVPHRAMVQARQIYVYAHAARLGWFPQGAALAEGAMARLLRDYEARSGDRSSFAFSIDTGTGATVSEVRDAYTHAFVLFAVAHLHALNGDPALVALADRVVAFVERDLVDPRHGGVLDALPAASPEKRQNPQMHLLEAYLALDEAMPGRGHDARAAALVRLFGERLFHADHRVLPEYFGADWSDHHDAGRHLFEPGHHYEWAWLLHQHEARTGESTAAWRRHLLDAAEAHGHHDSGLIFDELHVSRRVAKPSHRLWPHTEAIKAAAVAHAGGDAAALPFAQRMAGLLSEHFLGRPFAGGWTDHLGPDLAPLVDYVPASSLYHLFLAAAEADRCLLPAREAAPAG